MPLGNESWTILDKSEDIPCKTCGCNCRGSSADAGLENDNKDVTQKVKTIVYPAKNTNKLPDGNFKEDNTSRKSKSRKLIRNLLSAPSNFQVPRTKEFESSNDLIDCWRNGNVDGRKIIPLYKLKNASERVNVWSGYSDK